MKSACFTVANLQSERSRMQKNYRPGGVGMVPAPIGTYLVHAYFDDNQVDLVKSNVLGWQVGADRKVTPLLVDPRAADSEPWYVIHADGRVECSDGKVWEDQDSWIDDFRRICRNAA